MRKIAYRYDASGNRETIIRSIQGKDEIEQFKYDSFDRLIEKKDALGNIDTYKYGTKINQKTHIDPMGLETIETCNAQNRIASLKKQNGGRTLALEEKYYDENGKKILQIDTVYTPSGEDRRVHTRWIYNSRGFLEQLVEASGTGHEKITKSTYTPRGELATLTKPDGVVLIYRYNDLGHLISLVSSDQTIDYQMEYNRLGHLQKSGSLIRTADRSLWPHYLGDASLWSSNFKYL